MKHQLKFRLLMYLRDHYYLFPNEGVDVDLLLCLWGLHPAFSRQEIIRAFINHGWIRRMTTPQGDEYKITIRGLMQLDDKLLAQMFKLFLLLKRNQQATLQELMDELDFPFCAPLCAEELMIYMIQNKWMFVSKEAKLYRKLTSQGKDFLEHHLQPYFQFYAQSMEEENVL